MIKIFRTDTPYCCIITFQFLGTTRKTPFFEDVFPIGRGMKVCEGGAFFNLRYLTGVPLSKCYTEGKGVEPRGGPFLYGTL